MTFIRAVGCRLKILNQCDDGGVAQQKNWNKKQPSDDANDSGPPFIADDADAKNAHCAKPWDVNAEVLNIRGGLKRTSLTWGLVQEDERSYC